MAQLVEFCIKATGIRGVFCASSASEPSLKSKIGSLQGRAVSRDSQVSVEVPHLGSLDLQLLGVEVVPQLEISLIFSVQFFNIS